MTSDIARRSVAVASLCAISLLAWILVAAPLRSLHAALDSQLEERQFQIGRLRAIRESEGELDTRTAMLARRSLTQLGFLSNVRPSLAGAELQSHVQSLAQDSGAVLLTSEVLPLKDNERFSRIAVKMHLRVALEELQALSYQLEYAHPTCFLDEVSISKVPERTSRDRVDSLDVWMTVYAYADTDSS